MQVMWDKAGLIQRNGLVGFYACHSLMKISTTHKPTWLNTRKQDTDRSPLLAFPTLHLYPLQKVVHIEDSKWEKFIIDMLLSWLKKS